MEVHWRGRGLKEIGTGPGSVGSVGSVSYHNGEWSLVNIITTRGQIGI